MPGAFVGLMPCSHGTHGSDHAVNAQQDQISAGKIVDGREGEQGAEEHQEPQNQTDDVDDHGEVVHPIPTDQANVTQMGQPGHAVGDKPDGEQQGEHQGPGSGVYQQHDTGHDTENAGDQGDHRAQSCVAVHFDEQDDVCDAHDDGGQAVGKHHALEGDARGR